MTSLDVHLLMLSRYPNATCILADASYRPITLKTLNGVGELYRDLAFALGCTEWTPQHDCDDKSQLAHCGMAAMHRKAQSKLSGTDKPQSAAFGRLWYTLDSGTGHALNWAITEEGIIEWEPQHQKRVYLSDSECLSARYVFA